MAWRIVKQPNGLLARWSDRVDDFTEYNMTQREAIYCCMEYAGRPEATEKVQRGIDAGPTRFEDAINTIERVHGKQVAETRRRELSDASKL